MKKVFIVLILLILIYIVGCDKQNVITNDDTDTIDNDGLSELYITFDWSGDNNTYFTGYGMSSVDSMYRLNKVIEYRVNEFITSNNTELKIVFYK